MSTATPPTAPNGGLGEASAQVQVGQTSPTIDRSRQKRSRKDRPCDRCRRSKLGCKIGPEGPPCSQCAEFHRSCTFEEAPIPRPPPKKRRTVSPDGTGTDSDAPRYSFPSAASMAYAPPQLQLQAPPLPGGGRGNVAVQGIQQVSGVTTFDALGSNFEPHVITTVLTTDLFAITSGSDDASGHVCQISSDSQHPVYVVMQPKGDVAQLPVTGAIPLQHIRTFLRSQGRDDKSVLDLYHIHVHPAVPILLPGSGDQQPPLLLCSILAKALGHSKATRSLAPTATGLLSTVGSLVENNLTGVASAVVELDMTQGSASYILLAKTIALAQVLGMHMDPNSWRIPEWEQGLRVRLWWMLCIHDAWNSFLNSRPCHIQEGNSNVELPRLATVLEASCAHGSASSDSAKAFIASCRLSLLVRQLQHRVSVLQVTGARHAASRRSAVEHIIRDVDHLWMEWQSFAWQPSRAVGVGKALFDVADPDSFLIHLLGFRCMLQRIAVELEFGLGSPFVVKSTHVQPFSDCVSFIAALPPTELDGYFMIYAAHIMGSVTSSLIRFTMASPDRLNDETLQLLSTLLRALHRYKTEYGWDLGEPALRRANTMAKRLDDIQEHPTLAAALRGGSVTSPVDLTTMFTGMESFDWSNWNFDDINLFQ